MNKLHHESKQRSTRENKIFSLVSSFLKFEFYKFSYVKRRSYNSFNLSLFKI